MTVIWLLVWLIEGLPPVVFSTAGGFSPNSWAIALVICFALDALWAVSRD